MLLFIILITLAGTCIGWAIPVMLERYDRPHHFVLIMGGMLFIVSLCAIGVIEIKNMWEKPSKPVEYEQVQEPLYRKI